MTAEALLAKLERVKRTGDGRWLASCPGHDDKTPSLAVRELPDGTILLHCFAGCSVESIVDAVGLELADLFPPRPPGTDHVRAERRPFLPSDVFEIARTEIGVAAVIACDMHKDRKITEADYKRLLTCVDRLEGIARAAYAR